MAQIGYAQDTIKVEPVNFGFPETPSINWGAKEKYGLDTAMWPAWILKSFDRSKGMALDEINTESLRINDTLPLVLDTLREFIIQKPDTSISKRLKNKYYQDGLIYVQRDSVIEFLSLKRPVEGQTLKLSGIHNGERVDLSSLSRLRQILQKSYDWRDAISRWVVGSFYTQEEEIRITMLPIALSSNQDMLELTYYDDRLVYIYLKKN